MSRFKLYLKLFLFTFYLSAFTFGGGYVIVPLMKKKFAQDLKWIDEKEMLDLVAVAQSSPGPIAVNASIIIGNKIAGIAGSLFAILGTVLPPLITITAISFFYGAFKDNQIIAAMLKGMQAGIAAVIADVVITMCAKIVKSKNVVSVILLAAIFIAVYFFNINVGYIILFCVFAGIALYFINKKKAVKKNDIP